MEPALLCIPGVLRRGKVQKMTMRQRGTILLESAQLKAGERGMQWENSTLKALKRGAVEQGLLGQTVGEGPLVLGGGGGRGRESYRQCGEGYRQAIKLGGDGRRDQPLLCRAYPSHPRGPARAGGQQPLLLPVVGAWGPAEGSSICGGCRFSSTASRVVAAAGVGCRRGGEGGRGDELRGTDAATCSLALLAPAASRRRPAC